MNSSLIYRNPQIENDVLLSFIIPTYKNNRFLDTAITGIVNQRGCSFSSYEIIVISNDPTAVFDDYVEKYRNEKISFYVNTENYGQVGNMNQGISLAIGKYVSFVHDDDVILPNYMIEMLPLITDRNKDYECIIPSYYLIYDEYKVDLKHKFLDVFFILRRLYRKKLALIKTRDFIYSFDNIYGAPTCGTVFLKKTIIEFGYFQNERGAAWDFYNFRLFHKCHNIYFLHTYVGIRRSETGMSKESRVQIEFEEDIKLIVRNDENDNPFISKYSEAIIAKRPKLKYLWFRMRTLSYFYLRNLDMRKAIPKSEYRKFKNYERTMNI